MRMAVLAVKPNKGFNPLHVHLLGANAVVLDAQTAAHLI